MALHLNRIKDQRSEVKVTFGEESANVTYNKNAISTKEWREIRKRSQGEGSEADDEFSVAVLSRLLVKWDVLDSDKPGAKPYPITPDSLDALPPQFLNAVVKAVVEDLFPGPDPEAPAASSGSFS